MNAESLAAQILRRLDARLDHQVIGDPIGKSREHFQIGAVGNRADDRCAAGVTDVDLVGRHSGDKSRRAAHKDRIRAHAVFGEEAALAGNPKWRDSCVHRRVGDDDFARRGGAISTHRQTANEIDVGYTGGTAVVGAVANGTDLKVLSAFTNRVTYDLMVKPGIKTPEDLRGKRFGIQSIGGTVWMGAILALEHLNLDAERDKISILAVGDQNVLAQALESGTIDATVLDGVQSRRLAALGFSTLADLNKFNLPILSSGFDSARTKHSEKILNWQKNYLKAVIEGATFELSLRRKTEYSKNSAKISEGQRERRRGRLSRPCPGHRQETVRRSRRHHQRRALDEAKQSKSRERKNQAVDR